MITLFQRTWKEIDTDIAKRMIRLRKRKKLSQRELAAKSGVSLGSLKRFEQSGEISLQSFTKLAIALGVEDELDNLFTEVPFESIEEVIHEQTK
ncbi:MAG: helix-turn-helix transcriptional regulator [Agathobacter sp.]|jgi:transcriptional regulator with XRE-family HTH domain|nr:helix-turn-helix transcriptional regulator [Agathobacter sp.]